MKAETTEEKVERLIDIATEIWGKELKGEMVIFHTTQMVYQGKVVVDASLCCTSSVGERCLATVAKQQTIDDTIFELNQILLMRVKDELSKVAKETERLQNLKRELGG